MLESTVLSVFSEEETGYILFNQDCALLISMKTLSLLETEIQEGYLGTLIYND